MGQRLLGASLHRQQSRRHIAGSPEIIPFMYQWETEAQRGNGVSWGLLGTMWWGLHLDPGFSITNSEPFRDPVLSTSL